MIHAQTNSSCGDFRRTNRRALCAALAAVLVAGAAAAEPQGIRERTSPTCVYYYYQNFTEPATGAAGCRVYQGGCQYLTPTGTCPGESWYCPESCGDPARRLPNSCEDPNGRKTCGIPSNGLAISTWTANTTVEEDGGRCFLKEAWSLYRGPPYSRSIDYKLNCNSTAPCRWDLLTASRRVTAKPGTSTWVLEASHLLTDPKVSDASMAGAAACRAAMACPPFLAGLLRSAAEVDYGGTGFVCLPGDAGFKDGILVKRDAMGRAACLDDGTGSCMVLPGPCCDVLGRSTAAVYGLRPTMWPAVPCPAGASWCARALAATAELPGFNPMLGFNCTFNAFPGPNRNTFVETAHDRSAGPWTAVRSDHHNVDPDRVSKSTYSYRILRRTGTRAIACMGYNFAGQSGTCLDAAITDPGCAANLARTVPWNIYWQVLDRTEPVYADRDALRRLGLDPSQPVPAVAPDPPRPPPRGPWTCVQLCGEGGDRILVRYLGSGGGVQCKGPDAGRCSLFRGADCASLAPNEPDPHASGEVGYICSEEDQKVGWCARAAAAVVPWGSGVADCPAADIKPPCNGTCSPSASCIREGTRSFCSCNDGFFGDGATCAPDPCAANNGGCPSAAMCTPTAGGPVCTCLIGYVGDGRTCLPDPCAGNGGCSPHASCTRTGWSSRTCACLAGYAGNGTHCREEPCAGTTCGPHAACMVSAGLPYCMCLGGYTGNGYDCRSKCLTRNGGCSANAVCSIKPGGRAVACTCKAAYYGNGVTCRAKGAVRLSLSVPASSRRGRAVALSAKALNAAGKAVPSIVISFQIGSGARVNATTNAGGTASVRYWLPAKAALGRTAVVARFLGTGTLLQTSATSTLTVVR
ncbi:hypothetical protein DFJ74DRAFT_747908 [Hyaloraphidium curvatum]|nr:hypothetical protein DFJ74DRAFT_747908 [Hyaloraphidium curvatum]